MSINGKKVTFYETITFAGTVNPVIYQGVTPVLIDSEPNTWNMESPFAGGIRSVKTYFLPGISRLAGTGAYAGVDVWRVFLTMLKQRW